MSGSHDVVWAGRGELVPWPEVDWLILREPGYEPIWDRQPMTSSHMWSKWMSGRDGRDSRREPRTDGIFYVSSVPKLTDVDLYERVREALARRAREGAKWFVGEQRLSQPSTPPIVRPKAKESDAVKELQIAEQERPSEVVALCAMTNKVRHRSRLWAMVHRNRLAALEDERYPERLEAYKCRNCGDWHVGHKV